MGDGLFKRGAVYHAWVDGQRVSTGQRSREVARVWHDREERIALDPNGHAQAKATFGDAIDLLIRDRESQVKAGKKSAETVEFYRKKSAVIFYYVKPESRLQEFTARTVDEYIEARRDDAGENTIHRTHHNARRLEARKAAWPLER